MRRLALLFSAAIPAVAAVLLGTSPALRARLARWLESLLPVTAERLAFGRLPTCTLPPIGDTTAWVQYRPMYRMLPPDFRFDTLANRRGQHAVLRFHGADGAVYQELGEPTTWRALRAAYVRPGGVECRMIFGPSRSPRGSGYGVVARREYARAEIELAPVWHARYDSGGRTRGVIAPVAFVDDVGWRYELDAPSARGDLLLRVLQLEDGRRPADRSFEGDPRWLEVRANPTAPADPASAPRPAAPRD